MRLHTQFHTLPATLFVGSILVLGFNTSNAADAVKVKTNSIGMKLVEVPGGDFQMGNPLSEEDKYVKHQGPTHDARISPFLLGQYEVTQGQYKKVTGKNPSYFTKDSKETKGEDTDNLPVERVSWLDAALFCNKLSEMEDLPPYYVLTNKQVVKKKVFGEEKTYTYYDVKIAGGTGYRLPTEAEWEYACLAGTDTPYSHGEVADGSMSNISGKYPVGTDFRGPNRERTLAVGSFKPNPFGLYDMHGNVWELCTDQYDDEAYEKRIGQAIVADPLVFGEQITGGPNVRHSMRGGSWQAGGKPAATFYRYYMTAAYAESRDTGFRVARSLK